MPATRQRGEVHRSNYRQLNKRAPDALQFVCKLADLY